MKRSNRFLAALGLLALLISGPVAASTITGSIYKGRINVVNSSYAAANFVVPVTINTQNLIDGKYILSDCSDIALQDSTGADTAFMPAPGAGTAWMIFVPDIQQNLTNNYYLYTGGTTSGGKLRYFPADGGMTVPDAAGLELGANNFEIEIPGFVNTSSGADKNLINKPGAVLCNVSASGTITVTTYAGAAGTDQTYNTGTSQREISGAAWYAQSFTTGSQQLLNYVQLYCYGAHSGIPAGTTSVSIYAVAGSGQPTGSSLATATLADSSITADQFNTWTFATPLYLANATKYIMVVSDPTATSANHWHWGFNNSNGYANGSFWGSSNSGATWTETAGADFRFLTNAIAASQITATSQSSAEHNYKINRTGSTLTLYDGVTSLGSTPAITVVNNANAWVFAKNSSILYMEYINITISGTLKGSWTWENAATFTDLSGNSNTATPTFATTASVANVTASLVGFAPLYPSSGGIESTTSGPAGPITSVPAEPVVSDVGPDQITKAPGGSAVFNWIDDQGIPPGMVTYPLMAIAQILTVFAVYNWTRCMGWTGIVLFMVAGLFIVWRWMPWPALFFYGVFLAFSVTRRGAFSRA